VKVSKNEIDRIMSSTRPTAPGFADSQDGRELLSSLLARQRPAPGRRRWHRPALLVSVGLGVLLAAGAGTAVATYRAPVAPPGWQSLTDGRSIPCVSSEHDGGGEVTVRAGESPYDACRRAWPQIMGRPAPRNLFACVVPVTTQVTPGVGPSIGSAMGVVIIDGDRFGNAPETCGAGNMFVAPPLAEWWGTDSGSPAHS
jgi:hypothetical protein